MATYVEKLTALFGGDAQAVNEALAFARCIPETWQGEAHPAGKVDIIDGIKVVFPNGISTHVLLDIFRGLRAEFGPENTFGLAQVCETGIEWLNWPGKGTQYDEYKCLRFCFGEPSPWVDRNTLMKWAREPERWLYGTEQGKKAKECLRLKLMGVAPAFTREEMLKFARAFAFAGAELRVNRKTYSNYRVKRKRTEAS